MPFFTIITATYNAGATLPSLAASLAAQTCRDFQWVVQDGGSSDNTALIVEEWRSHVPVSFESTKDTGIYDAWNRAITRTGNALGQWVLFLGADDRPASSDVLEQVRVKLLHAPPGVILGMGNLQHIALDGSDGGMWITDAAEGFAHRFMYMTVPHPALFTRGSIFANNMFDASFRIAGDYDWLIRVWQDASQACTLDLMVTLVAFGGVSTNPDFLNLVSKENRRILRKHFPLRPATLPLYFFLLLESCLRQQKQRLKQWCSSTQSGKHVWAMLNAARSAWMKSSKL